MKSNPAIGSLHWRRLSLNVEAAKPFRPRIETI
jgi:hypothetical protein